MNDTSVIQQAIAHQIHKMASEVVNDEVKKAVAACEQRIRARTGEIAATVCGHFSYESFGQDIRITVKFSDRPAVTPA